MAGYSRESERQNKALKSILRGENPQKRIMVANVDKEFQEYVKKEREEEQKRINEKLDATKEARLPWFCPSCDKIMKKSLDEKMCIYTDIVLNVRLKLKTK